MVYRERWTFRWRRANRENVGMIRHWSSCVDSTTCHRGPRTGKDASTGHHRDEIHSVCWPTNRPNVVPPSRPWRHHSHAPPHSDAEESTRLPWRPLRKFYHIPNSVRTHTPVNYIIDYRMKNTVSTMAGIWPRQDFLGIFQPSQCRTFSSKFKLMLLRPVYFKKYS